MIKRWKKQLDEIVDDVTDLVLSRYIFKEVILIVGKNRKLNTTNPFWDFLKTSYVSSLVLGISRQVDPDPRSLSLINLLDEISGNPKAITKKWFTTQYRKNKQGWSKKIMAGQAKTDFEREFGKVNFINPASVRRDKSTLLLCTREIIKFRNKRIAHKDKSKQLKFNVRFTDLYKAIDSLEKIALKYNLLLNQSAYHNDSLLPVIPFDWQRIFRSVWLRS